MLLTSLVSRSSVVFLICALLVTGERGADAQTLTAGARKLVAQGDAALQAGQTAEALARFEQALRQSAASPPPLLLQRLGQVAEVQGRRLLATDLYRRYLEEEELDPKAQQPLRERVQQPGEPSAEVAVFGDEGAVVLVDERLVGALPLSLPLLLPLGTHKLRIEKGAKKVETQVRLSANRPLQVRFTLVPPLAVATPTGLAVLLLEARGAPEALLQRVARAANQAAGQERVLLLPRDKLEAALQRAPQLKACLDTLRCQEQLAAQVEAQYVLGLKIDAELTPGKKKDEGRFEFALRLHDVRVAAEAASQRGGCSACGVERASQTLTDLTMRLIQDGTTRPQGTLEVAVTPAGAAVALDGRARGPAPLKTAAFAGGHEVQVTLAEHQPFQGAVTVSDGEVARLPVTLQRLAPPPKAPPPAPVAATPLVRKRPIYKRPWFLATLGGVVLVGTGVAIGLSLGLNRSTFNLADYTNPFILSF